MNRNKGNKLSSVTSNIKGITNLCDKDVDIFKQKNFVALFSLKSITCDNYAVFYA